MENSENKVHGLLFDGAWLWEEYLNTILKDCGFEHPENKTKKNGLPLFESSQKIYPDFYKKKPNIVIDAKYKKLQNYDNLTTGDLYQVITYMYRLQANKGVLLYPLQKNDVQEKNKVVQFNMNKDSYGGVKAIFEKYGMLIPQAKNEYQEFVMEINKHEKELQKDIID
jgi:5-methylcytosine-specific restriction endonuclease McrBC regulatory subunit McrC